MLEKNDIKKIKKGDIITLTDFQSLQENVKGISYTVSNVEKLQIDANLTFWIFGIEDKGNEFTLTIVESDSAYEIKMFFSSDDYPFGFRTEILSQGHNWLFLPPENLDDFYVEDLDYAPFITPNFSNHLLPPETEFELYGFKSGIFYTKDEQNTVMVKEYKTKQDVLNQFLMIIERFKDDSQGFVNVMQGALIDKTDVEYY